MHIKVTDEEDESHVSEICYDRSSRKVRVLHVCCDSHLFVLERIAASLGAPTLQMAVAASDIEKWTAQGYDDAGVYLLEKKLNGH